MTALGVSMSPSRLGRVMGCPRSSRVAIAQKVVPRSIPTSLPAMGDILWKCSSLDPQACEPSASRPSPILPHGRGRRKMLAPARPGSPVAPPLLVLVGRADEDQPAVGPRHGAADEDEIILGINADDLEVADGDALGAVAAGHAHALLGPAVATVAGARAHRAALPLALLDAVAGAQAAEVVALDHARRAAPLGR